MEDSYRERLGAAQMMCGNMRTTTIRASGQHFAILEVFADNEGSKPSELIREAILRIIDSREQDDKYMAALSPESKKKLAEIAEESYIALGGLDKEIGRLNKLRNLENRS